MGHVKQVTKMNDKKNKEQLLQTTCKTGGSV